jgi:hypothetical protein
VLSPCCPRISSARTTDRPRTPGSRVVRPDPSPQSPGGQPRPGRDPRSPPPDRVTDASASWERPQARVLGSVPDPRKGRSWEVSAELSLSRLGRGTVRTQPTWRLAPDYRGALIPDWTEPDGEATRRLRRAGDFLRSSRQWTSPVVGCRHSRIRYSKPGRSTIGIGSGEAGATAPTTIFASTGMNGDCAGIGAVTISTGSA